MLNPFDNLMEALERAAEVSSPYNETNLTIKLMKGQHFLLREVPSFKS